MAHNRASVCSAARLPTARCSRAVHSAPMKTRFCCCLVLSMTMLCLPARAHEGQPHQPFGSEDGHVHSHPEIDVSHPIVTESAVPETHFVLRPYFADGGGGSTEYGITGALEYAFVPTFSLELSLPYVVQDPDDAGPFGRIGSVELAAKFATYAFADHGFIPAFGLSVTAPTGRDEQGVGSDHIIGLEPFLRAGVVRGPFHFAAEVSLGFSLNQTAQERDQQDFSLGYNLAVIYHALPNVQPLVEFHGGSSFGDDDSYAFYISPGVTFQPFADESINLGIGVSLPVTSNRDFDYSVNLMAIVHL